MSAPSIRSAAAAVGLAVLAVLAGLALSACTPTGQPPASSAAPDPDATTATAPAAAPATQAPSGSPLTGNVSDLKGTVSQLQGLVTALGGEIREREIVVALPADVLFAFDKADIQPAAEPTLRTLAELLAKAGGTAQVNGHADAKGDDAYNLALSARRAQAVVAWLAAHGTDTSRLTAAGLGEQRPVAPNTGPDGQDDPAGRAKNRRVEVIIPRS